MTALEILKGARALLVEKGWTQGVCARDVDGIAVPSADNDAACFCALGAMGRAESLGGGGEWTLATLAYSRQVGGNISQFNDAPGRTKDEVLAAFDRAIAGLEGSS